MRVEPACLEMREQRFFVESAVAARVDEPGEELGIVAVARRLAQQPNERMLRLPDVRLELRVELVGDRQPRIERNRPLERVFGVGLAVRRVLDVLANHTVAAAEMGPRRRKARIEIEGVPVEIARLRQPRIRARQLVRAQIELICARALRRIRRRRRQSSRQRQRQRLHHAPREIVLQPEEIAQRRLDRVRGEQRPAGRFDQLRRGSQLIAGAQQRAHDHPIHVGFGRQHLEVRCVAGKSRGSGARAHDQRADARQ